MSMPLALISLSPPFLIVAYVSVLMVRRELTILFGFVGQLACEAFNLILKRTFKQGRPTTFLGTGYGMPSSHSQFAGYFAAFWTLHLLRNRPGMSRKRRGGATSMIDFLRSAEHFILLALINVGSLATAYSRYHLSYHTPTQIAVGIALGVACGVAWYVVCEVYMHKSVLGFSCSVRRTLLDNPLFVALRVRDSWAVWDDAGIEAEYGLWRGLWDGREKRGSGRSSSSLKVIDTQHMLHALRLASHCEETTTAFSVGCVVCRQHDQEVLSTGFSREQAGNTHAEEVALNKLMQEAGQTSGNKTNVDVALTLYTTMEPCSERLSKKDACVQRILQFNAANVIDRRSGGRLFVRRIVQGVCEPEDFVKCVGSRLLEESGLQVDHLRPSNVFRHEARPFRTLTLEDGWLEREAVRLAKFGHPNQPHVHGEEDRVWKEESWLQVQEEASSRPTTTHVRQADNLRFRHKR